MISNLDAIFEPLRSLSVHDSYRHHSLPPECIISIDTLVDIFLAGSWDVKREISRNVDAKFSFAFFMYAQQSAVESVRGGTPEMLMRGLLALAIENLAFDCRDSITILAQLYHSARRFPQIATDELFRHVVDISCLPFRETLEGFVNRSDAGKSIEVFGLRESTPPAPFNYETVRPARETRAARVRKLLQGFRRLIPILR